MIVEFYFGAEYKLREIVQTCLSDLHISRYKAMFFLPLEFTIVKCKNPGKLVLTLLYSFVLRHHDIQVLFLIYTCLRFGRIFLIIAKNRNGCRGCFH